MSAELSIWEDSRVAVCFCGTVHLPRPWGVTWKEPRLCKACGYAPFEPEPLPAQSIRMEMLGRDAIEAVCAP